MSRLTPVVQLLGVGITLAAVACGSSSPRGVATTDEDGRPGSADAPVGLPWDSLPLPRIELPDLSAHTVSLTPGRDEVTVVNFWATWCVPCLKEIPELVALHARGRAAGVRVVGISIASGSRQDIQAFAAKHTMDYLLLDADEEWGRRYFRQLGLPLFLPLTLVVDGHGVIRRRLIGPQTRAQFETAIREAS